MHTILGRRLVGYDQVLYQFLVSTSPIGVSDWGFHLCNSKEVFCISWFIKNCSEHYICLAHTSKVILKMRKRNKEMKRNQSHVVGRGEPLGSEVFFVRKKFWEFLILKNSFGSYVGNLGAEGSSRGYLVSYLGVIWGVICGHWGSSGVI